MRIRSGAGLGEAGDGVEQSRDVVGFDVAHDAGTHDTATVGEAELADHLDGVGVPCPRGDALGGQRRRHGVGWGTPRR